MINGSLSEESNKINLKVINAQSIYTVCSVSYMGYSGVRVLFFNKTLFTFILPTCASLHSLTVLIKAFFWSLLRNFTLARVAWAVNFLGSFPNLKDFSRFSTSSCKTLNFPAAPNQKTLGFEELGKTPSPPIIASKGSHVMESRAEEIDGILDSSTSPRNFKVM